MNVSKVWITPDYIYHTSPVNGATEKNLIKAEYGKVLHNNDKQFDYIYIAVDTIDGWSEIAEDTLTDDEANETDYENALRMVGVNV